jgi:hypothetical protein
MADSKKTSWKNQARDAKRKHKQKQSSLPSLPSNLQEVRVGMVWGAKRNGDPDHIKEIHELCSTQRTPHLHVITEEGSYCKQFPYPSSGIAYPSYLRSSANPNPRTKHQRYREHDDPQRNNKSKSKPRKLSVGAQARLQQGLF